jgi:glutathione S-transferase
MANEIFLHHYDASPFTQKALKMLAVKGLSWRSVEQPMIAPKPELTALTGGYRGTPVLQIGADIFIDSQLIAEALEARFPEPTLYPGGKGLAHILCDWADSYFRAGLDIALKELAASWPEEFYKDRDELFSDLDFSAAEARFPGACARLRNSARYINEQLSDGRAYFTGDAPGLPDIQVYVVNWFTRGAFPFVTDMFSDFEFLPAWEERMAALGEGDRKEGSIEEAYQAAKDASPSAEEYIDPLDPLGLSVGQNVEVSPQTSRRGVAKGKLYRLTPEEVVIIPGDAKYKTFVHYPRLGYAVHGVSVR